MRFVIHPELMALLETIDVLDVLKNSHKYVFITAREYKEYLVNQGVGK